MSHAQNFSAFYLTSHSIHCLRPFSSLNNVLTKHTRRDTSAPLTKAQFLAWIEKGLKIDLSADVSIEDAGTALGVLFEQVGKKGDQKEEKKPGEATTQEHRAVEAEGKDVAKMRDEQG